MTTAPCSWYSWEVARPKAKEWLRETCGNDFCVLEEYEVCERVSEMAAVRAAILPSQVLVAFVKAFFIYLNQISSGVAFLRASRSWPEGIVLKVMDFRFDVPTNRLLRTLLVKQQCANISAHRETEVRSTAIFEEALPKKLDKKRQKKQIKLRMQALRRRGIFCSHGMRDMFP
eukprot:s3398_g14.t1